MSDTEDRSDERDMFPGQSVEEEVPAGAVAETRESISPTDADASDAGGEAGQRIPGGKANA